MTDKIFRYMTALSDEQVFAELYYTRQVIKDLLNVTVTCWRPPFGDVDNRVRLVANELGMQTIVWSEDTVRITIRTALNPNTRVVLDLGVAR